ncbi:MAG: TetR family transcriptional regulator C-terminal domain-containing protein [Pseudomonadota bacterium]
MNCFSTTMGKMASAQKAEDKNPREQEPQGRIRLVKALLSCLADYGYQGTSLRRVAERAQVTAGLVRHHFDSKDALFVEAYRQINQDALDRMAVAIEDEGRAGQPALPSDLGADLAASVRAFFPDDLQDPQQMRVMVAFWGLVMTQPEIAAIQKSTYDAFQDHFVAVMERHLGPRDDLGEIANGIIAIADGLWLECCLNPERMHGEQSISIAIDFARTRLGLPGQ